MRSPKEPVNRFKVHFYATEQGGEPVRDWLRGMPKPERLILGQAIQSLQMEGPKLSMLYARPLGKGLYELRERIGKVRYRIFYIFDGEKAVVLLHAVLKDQRVEEQAISLARRRQKDYSERKKAYENKKK